jgi:hypothetical protein
MDRRTFTGVRPEVATTRVTRILLQASSAEHPTSLHSVQERDRKPPADSEAATAVMGSPSRPPRTSNSRCPKSMTRKTLPAAQILPVVDRASVLSPTTSTSLLGGVISLCVFTVPETGAYRFCESSQVSLVNTWHWATKGVLCTFGNVEEKSRILHMRLR